MKLKRGDKREDGKIFWSRGKSHGKDFEWWVTEEHFQKMKQKEKDRPRTDADDLAVRNWEARNPDRVRARKREWAARNPEKIAESRARQKERMSSGEAPRPPRPPRPPRIAIIKEKPVGTWASRNPDRMKEIQARHRAKKRELGIGLTPIQKLKRGARSRISQALKGKKLSTCIHLGCSWKELADHLESQFQPGMTWENYGFHGWHVDHRIPIASAQTLEDLAPLLHFSNLQPLWGKDNMSKGAKIL